MPTSTTSFYFLVTNLGPAPPPSLPTSVPRGITLMCHESVLPVSLTPNLNPIPLGQ